MSVQIPTQPDGAGTFPVVIQECSEYFVSAATPANVTSITLKDGSTIDISGGAQRAVLPPGDVTVVTSGATDLFFNRVSA
jgi:hypothetical protein